MADIRFETIKALRPELFERYKRDYIAANGSNRDAKIKCWTDLYTGIRDLYPAPYEYYVEMTSRHRPPFIDAVIEWRKTWDI